MGYHYNIINHTKKERAHFDNRVKYTNITSDVDVMSAYMSYFALNNKDDIQLIDDDGEYIDVYKDVDLSRL